MVLDNVGDFVNAFIVLFGLVYAFNIHLHLADAFIQSDSGYIFFVSMCVPWELNPQPLRC